MNRLLGIFAALAFIGTVFAANWAVDTFGIVELGFGLAAPAAVFFVGLAFLLRDSVQTQLGKGAVVVCIAVGAGLSYFVNPGIALASAAAFAASESLDFVVFTALRKRTLTGAVTVSNIAGAMLDSYIFLALAFGSLAFFWGQVAGKIVMTVPALIVLLTVHGRGVVCERRGA